MTIRSLCKSEVRLKTSFNCDLKFKSNFCNTQDYMTSPGLLSTKGRHLKCKMANNTKLSCEGRPIFLGMQTRAHKNQSDSLPHIQPMRPHLLKQSEPYGSCFVVPEDEWLQRSENIF